MSGAEGYAQQRTIPSFIGPLSVLGVCLGMIGWVVPVFYEVMSALYIGLPVSACLLVALPVRPARHFGTGLLASVLVWPFTLTGLHIFSVAG